MVLVYFVTGHISRPIVRLANIADRMSHLDFSARYEERREDEINLLGTSMNQMSRELEQTIQNLRQANIQLKRDIEEKVKVDEMRKEFISNVSHELKTPIALIQGYAEGLLEGISEDPESMQYYCEVIADEADKMNQLVRKLLTLNQIESGINTMERMDFDLIDMIGGVLHSFNILIRQNDITVDFESDRQVMIRADEFMMEEVVRNYVSNAIHHIDGEKCMDILVEENDRAVKVSVFNTGNPIPEDELDNVWQKFYKVDKAHTREYGGNGIGLSIVKAVMDSHGGTCGVYNTDEGVCFWFELNKMELPAVIV
jgi:signal transduction histidine kinase